MSIEEQLRRDIAAVTGGVVVTDSDLREARDAVEDRVEETRRRNRLVAAGAAAAAIVIPLVGFAVFQVLDEDEVGPAEPAPAVPSPAGADFLTGSDPTGEDVEGLWRVDNSTLLMLFNRDGTVQYDDAGTLYTSPTVAGTYVVEGDLITVTVESGPAECVGQVFVMQAALPGPGEMRVVHGEREVAGCAPAAPGQRLVLEHVLPLEHEELSQLSAPGGRLQPPERDTLLHGDWMTEGDDVMVEMNDGGFVLELSPDGRYVFASTGDIVEDSAVAVVDSGTWSLSGDRLRFVSEGGPANPHTGAPVCAPGSRFDMESVGHADSDGLVVLRGTWADESCAAGWAPSTFFLLSPGR
jgi:hypothetical protein